MKKTSSSKHGFHKKPLELHVLPWIFLLAPLLNIAGWLILDAMKGPNQAQGLAELLRVNFSAFDRGSYDTLRGILLLVPYLFGLATAIGLWVVRPWGFWLCASSGLVNWLSSSWDFRFDGEQVLQPVFAPFMPAALINLAFFIPVLFLLRRDLVQPFFASHLRWWEQNKRLRLKLPLTVELKLGSVKVETLDISLRGCFIAEKKDWPQHKALGAKLDLGSSYDTVQLELQVLWTTEGSKHYPAGMGCSFHFDDRDQKAILERFLKDKMRQGEKPHLRD